MKKTFCILAASVMISLSMKAQTEKGYMIVGTQFSNVHINKSNFEIEATPTIGWFLSKDFALGGGIGLGYNKPKDGDGTFSYGVMPMARLYFAGTEKNKFFGQIGTGIEGQSTDGNSSTQWLANFTIGYNYFINKNVALELGAAYEYSKMEDVDGVSAFDLNFGLQVFLPTKKVKK